MSPHVEIAAVFGPEHGFRGSAQAGFSEGTSVDPKTKLTVYDAYAADQARWVAMLEESGVDTVVFDIQDVGARFYTYIWTLRDSLMAAAATRIPYLVLDRPNPIGRVARGPVLRREFASGVGGYPIAQQHGLTMGELARFYDTGAELEVVPFDGGDFPWVPPSPNMPTIDTARVYPGTGMMEAVVLSEGRGTTKPFELVGAPFLDYRWAERLNRRGLSGVEFREAYFTPTFDKFAGELCAGVEVKVVDPVVFDAIEVATAMLVEAREYAGFGWRESVGPFWIDKLTGSARFREMFDAGAEVADLVGSWREELAGYEDARRSILLYR